MAAGVLAALVAIGTAGCAGGSRSGSDQPGVPPPAASAGSSERAAIATSSEKDMQAALRANDVDDPDRWAKVVAESGPYPPGAAGERKLRDVLAGEGAEPETTAGVLATLTP